MDLEDEPNSIDDAIRAFALACRLERDRLAQERLGEADRRFETRSDARLVAQLLAAGAIARAQR